MDFSVDFSGLIEKLNRCGTAPCGAVKSCSCIEEVRSAYVERCLIGADARYTLDFRIRSADVKRAPRGASVIDWLTGVQELLYVEVGAIGDTVSRRTSSGTKRIDADGADRGAAKEVTEEWYWGEPPDVSAALPPETPKKNGGDPYSTLMNPAAQAQIASPGMAASKTTTRGTPASPSVASPDGMPAVSRAAQMLLETGPPPAAVGESLIIEADESADLKVRILVGTADTMTGISPLDLQGEVRLNVREDLVGKVRQALARAKALQRSGCAPQASQVGFLELTLPVIKECRVSGTVYLSVYVKQLSSGLKCALEGGDGEPLGSTVEQEPMRSPRALIEVDLSDIAPRAYGPFTEAFQEATLPTTPAASPAPSPRPSRGPGEQVDKPEEPPNCRLPGHKGPVTCCTIFKDGSMVVTGSSDKTAILWSSLGKRLATLSGHAAGIVNCVVLPNQEQVLLVTADAEAALWDVVPRVVTKQLVLTDIRMLELFPDGNRVLTTGKTGSYCALFSLDGSPRKVLQGHSSPVTSLGVFPDGRRMLSTSEDGAAILWQEDGSQVISMKAHSARILSSKIFAAGDRVITTSKDCNAIIWSVRHGERKFGNPVAVLKHAQPVTCCAVFPDGEAVVTASADCRAHIWSRTGERLGTLEGHLDTIVQCSIFPRGDRVLTVSRDGSGSVWNTEGKQLCVLKGHREEISMCALCSRGEHAVTASVDHSAFIWRLSSYMPAVSSPRPSLGSVVTELPSSVSVAA
eukprot:TRINITY_DN122500_c0_g1_i1.p1 TRINITY_DN122500_c0_g1~~TRINITY_DN122500_c0_g1_i1.p1  ORF type:complete len:748 (-),score=131.50 TRINITY_DN122500_c0_g1_i1:54-2297(-)